mgnify:CR=1 FL=1
MDDTMKQQMDIAIKLEKLRHTKDLLQEKQKKIENTVEGFANRVDMHGGKVYRRHERLDNLDSAKIKVGKTGDSSTGKVSSEQVETAKVQVVTAKKFMLDQLDRKSVV